MFDPKNFHEAEQVPLFTERKSFLGYDRGERGVGTRNFVLVLSASVMASKQKFNFRWDL